MFQRKILKAPIKIPKLGKLGTWGKNSIDCGILFYAFGVFCVIFEEIERMHFLA